MLVRFALLLVMCLTGCMSVTPPRHVDDICSVFRQNPGWSPAARSVERRWHVPVAVQMAIMHQESKFDAYARPPRTKLLGIIPWFRPSTAYGYAQALDGTWAMYKASRGGLFASRSDFAYGVDFIGWYAKEAHQRANIAYHDAQHLYLAYHEGIGGYLRHTYRRKSWLMRVAQKVKARSFIYEAQLKHCKL